MEIFVKLEEGLKTSVKGVKERKLFKYNYNNGVRTLVELDIYNKDGYCIEKKISDIYDEPYSVKYKYDTKNRLIMIFMNTNNYTSYEYDVYDRIIYIYYVVSGRKRSIMHTYDDTSKVYYFTSDCQIPVKDNEVICETKNSYGDTTTYILDKNNYKQLKMYQVYPSNSLTITVYTYNNNSILINKLDTSYATMDGKLKDRDYTIRKYNDRGDIILYKSLTYYGDKSKNIEIQYEYNYEEKKTTSLKYDIKDNDKQLIFVENIIHDKNDKSKIYKTVSEIVPSYNRQDITEYEYEYYK